MLIIRFLSHGPTPLESKGPVWTVHYCLCSSPTINVGWRVNTVNESTRCAGQVVRSQTRYLSRMASILPTDQFPLGSIVSLSSNLGVTSPVERKGERNMGEQIEGLGQEETRLRKSWLGFCSYQTLSQHPDFWRPYEAEPLSPVMFLNQTQRTRLHSQVPQIWGPGLSAHDCFDFSNSQTSG